MSKEELKKIAADKFNVLASYSGNTKTMYLVGKNAKAAKAELRKLTSISIELG